MKKYIINKCMTFIKKKKKYDDKRLFEIKYGLEGIYLTITKLIFIAILAAFLGIFKEMVIYICIYNIIRTPSFGLHATKSWICLLSSSILFIGIPLLCLYITIPIVLKYIVGMISIIFMYKNSPADTKKRPIINRKRRKVYKYISTVMSMIFCILSVIIKNNFLSNCFLLSLVMQNFMISPIIYKIFKLPYNNYITFLQEHPEFSKQL